ncbi:MAG: hypothetical protein ACETWB_04250 [Anaerolineae bacterium]
MWRDAVSHTDRGGSKPVTHPAPIYGHTNPYATNSHRITFSRLYPYGHGHTCARYADPDPNGHAAAYSVASLHQRCFRSHSHANRDDGAS